MNRETALKRLTVLAASATWLAGSPPVLAAQYPFADTKVETIISADGVIDCSNMDGQAAAREVTDVGGVAITTDRCRWTVGSVGPDPEFYLYEFDVLCRLETVAALPKNSLQPEVYLRHVVSRGLSGARITDARSIDRGANLFTYLSVSGHLPVDTTGEYTAARWALTDGTMTAFFLCMGPTDQVSGSLPILERVAETMEFSP